MAKVDYRKLKWKIYDTVQYTWVSICILTTVAGLGLLGHAAYHYFVYERPMKKELEERYKEQLLKEGRMLREARDAELKGL